MESYYNPSDLAKFAEMGKDAPELWKLFSQWYDAVFQEGELSEREKALIALAVSHAVQCPYCIDAYTQACLEKGSNNAQMAEAVYVAAAIRGGASLVHGVQMNNIQKYRFPAKVPWINANVFPVSTLLNIYPGLLSIIITNANQK